MTKLIKFYKDLDEPNCIAVILGIVAGLFLGPWIIGCLMLGAICIGMTGDVADLRYQRVMLFWCALALTSMICMFVYVFKITPPTAFPSWQDIKNFLVR